MLTEEQRQAFDAECKAVCDRAREYEKKPAAEKLWDVRLALMKIAARCSWKAAGLGTAGDEKNSAYLGGVAASVSYLADIIQGVLEGQPVAPVAIESLRKELARMMPPESVGYDDIEKPECPVCGESWWDIFVAPRE